MSSKENTIKIDSFSDEHEAFAASRVSQYVFVPTKDIYFNTLDQHADTLEGDVKPPLVLLGNEGSGKSALLANWVAKRRDHKHRDEFLFQHFVGCTTESAQLSQMLFRLETALKDFFQLREMKVPDTEVELRWSLNRFLEAASKKHSPARIVIIIDGIHQLKSEGTPNGTLYWLPTDLPPCVRFIVSSVEFERQLKGKKESSSPHLTFVELSRRQCPLLRIEPLGVATRHSVINAFCNLNSGFEISENQQFKIVTCNATAQPMYLRTLLQALSLASRLTDIIVDELLEKFLLCGTAHELVDKNLSICTKVSGSDEYEENILWDLLGKMMSVVYVSRNGLTEPEIWGLIRMVSKTEVTPEHTDKLLSILKDFTMKVNEMYSFSHEIYREVVYSKFINSRQSLVRWHQILSRFFGQLPPCDRKLTSLPYHLEMAGSWSKVKNCLTDIEMFQIWWTPKFKTDFIKFWASLTNTKNNTGALGDNNDYQSSNMSGSSAGPSRPSYDIVDEYVKSLDEYRIAKKPSDEVVAGIILEIGDFLLEYATLGHEQAADVPALIHPKVLNEDLKAIGVPYVEIDEDGRSSLVYPDILHSLCNKQKSADDGPAMDAPTKAIEDVPVRTTYFYNRWMWIQFPYIALGNCDHRYSEGVNQKLQEMSDSQAKMKGKSKDTLSLHDTRNSVSADGRPIGKKTLLSKSLTSLKSPDNKGTNESSTYNSKSFKLPEIKFNRKAARTIPRILKEDEETASNSKVMQRIYALQDTIQNYREEYDFLIQNKAILSRRLQDFKDSLVDLQRTAESCNQFDDALDDAIKREQDSQVKYEHVKQLFSNLKELHMMCERHPANVPALITELQDKIELDRFLLKEMKKRLWEQKFEKQTHQVTFHQMKTLVQDAVDMHNKLLEYRYSWRKDLTQQAIEDEKVLEQNRLKNLKNSQTSDSINLNSKPLQNQSSETNLNKLPTGKSRKLPGLDSLSAEDLNPPPNKTYNTWDEKWNLIMRRTGITEPEAFFQRLNNASTLERQIDVLKKTSESRLEMLKKEVVTVESELEEVRYEASFAGVQSSKEHKKQLADKQSRLRHVKEKTEGMEQLEQKVVAGLAHISDILFIPKSEEDAPVLNLVRDIEAVLDTLINEREKQLQQQQGGQGTQGGAMRDSSTSVIPESFANRSPELDFVIAKHESPTVRLPKHLPSKPTSDNEEMFVREVIDDDDDEDGGTWDRTFVKTQSLKNIKGESKKNNKGQMNSKGIKEEKSPSS